MILIIFGATGDLSKRMLFPSLYHLHKSGKLSPDFQVIAFARRDYDDNSFSKYLLDEFQEAYSEAFDQESWNRFTRTISYFKGDLGSSEDFTRLSKKLSEMDASKGSCINKVFYLAISPDLYNQTFAGMRYVDISSVCKHREHSKIVVEKPFGRDLGSFHELNNQLLQLFSEEQIFRIDHYLGKETVKNILYFRAANPLFLNDWNKNTIEKIEVRALESVGVGERAEYYDQYGQTRDFMQSHLLQLLTLILLDLPTELTSENIRRAKMEVLKNLHVRNIFEDTLRGQYIQGVVEGKPVKSYREELTGDNQSNTETYIKVKAGLDLPNWEGVDIFLETGKRMLNKDTSITLYFKRQEKVKGITSRNKLVFQLQPREAIALDLQVKKPSLNELEIVPMLFKYQDNFRGLLPDAYESLLLNIFDGNHSSFISTEELEASWEFIDPITRYWQEQGGNGLKFYPAGSRDVER